MEEQTAMGNKLVQVITRTDSAIIGGYLSRLWRWPGWVVVPQFMRAD
jgi:hypothetical protein